MDGKWKVTYEVIGQLPNVAVPTHVSTVWNCPSAESHWIRQFAKVILGAKGGLPGQPGVETSVGAFVLPSEQPPPKMLFDRLLRRYIRKMHRYQTKLT